MKQYKQYAPDSYYHIYSRGLNKAKIFLDHQDIAAFLSFLKRYLSPDPSLDSRGRPYPSYSEDIELLTFAVMPNHFHFLVYQSKNSRAITNFMKSVMTSYSKYFNKKYHHLGPVFQSRYLAKLIEDEPHLYHISRYIHLNPTNWQTSPQTSLDFYTGKRSANWINPRKILNLFPSREAYLEFLESYDPADDEKYADIEPND